MRDPRARACRAPAGALFRSDASTRGSAAGDKPRARSVEEVRAKTSMLHIVNERRALGLVPARRVRPTGSCSDVLGERGPKRKGGRERPPGVLSLYECLDCAQALGEAGEGLGSRPGRGTRPASEVLSVTLVGPTNMSGDLRPGLPSRVIELSVLSDLGRPLGRVTRAEHGSLLGREKTVIRKTAHPQVRRPEFVAPAASLWWIKPPWRRRGSASNRRPAVRGGGHNR